MRYLKTDYVGGLGYVKRIDETSSPQHYPWSKNNSKRVQQNIPITSTQDYMSQYSPVG